MLVTPKIWSDEKYWANYNLQDPEIAENRQTYDLRPSVLLEGILTGSTWFFEETLDEYPVFSGEPYGVCDDLDNLLETYPEIVTSPRKFFIVLREVRKADQSAKWGWRWCKYGLYIGKQERRAEYLYDEPHISAVLCFHVYEILTEETTE